MLTEPIIDIIVYGYPLYLPISFKNIVYTNSDYNGDIRYFAKNASSYINPTLENNMISGYPLKSKLNVFYKSELTTRNLLRFKLNSFISLLDTKDYYDWIKDSDEIWLDNPEITNEKYIRGASSIFHMHINTRESTWIAQTTELQSHVGILFDWRKDEDETWDETPDITYQDYLQTTIS